jgi:hypothetical protein
VSRPCRQFMIRYNKRHGGERRRHN